MTLSVGCRTRKRTPQAPLIAVVAAAGLGKTYLAAQLTAPADRPTAGVFIQGGRLRVGGSLDDLARRIPGLKVERFEDLLEALNSAGAVPAPGSPWSSTA